MSILVGFAAVVLGVAVLVGAPEEAVVLLVWVAGLAAAGLVAVPVAALVLVVATLVGAAEAVLRGVLVLGRGCS